MPTESLPTYKVRKRGDLSSSSTSTKPTAKPDSTNPLVKKPSFSKNDSSASAGNSATSTTTAVAADQGLPKRVVKKSSEQALTSKLTRKSSIPTFKPSTKPIPPSTTSTALAEKFSTYISSTQIQKKLKVEHVKDLPAPKLSQPVNDQKQTGVVAELQLDRVSAKSKKRGLDETDEDNIYKPREVYTISKPPPNTPITLPTIQLKYPISLSRPRQTLATHYTDSELIALVVPEKYITLASIFEALEMTVSFMKARRMRCDFHRVQKPVEGASRR
ncbi:hypothetical protein HK098_006520 [Nowakowskiella sp. JEL0407]|nr:hypothetical protein HK098_006520 [Nowakowskiella sp. JEL0407]